MTHNEWVVWVHRQRIEAAARKFRMAKGGNPYITWGDWSKAMRDVKQWKPYVVRLVYP